MSYNTSDINKLKQQIKQYYSFIKNDGMILTNFAKYLLSKADMNIENAIINLKDMSIKDIQNKLYDLTLELNTGNEISDIIKNKINEENKKLNDIHLKVLEYVDLHKKYKNAIDIQINKNKNLEDEYILLKDTELKKINDYKEYHKLLKECSEKELTTLKDTIDGIYRNEIYDNEYTFEESKYIKKEPCIHLDVDKILEDIKNGSYYNKNIYEDDLKITCNTLNNNSQVIRFNFPIKYKSNNDEYIIKFYINNNNTTDKTCIKEYKHVSKTKYMIYITNYGRFIKSYEINFSPAIYKYNDNNKLEYTKINGNIIYNNSNTTITNNAACCICYRSNGYYNSHSCGASEFMTFNIGGEQNKINLIEQPKLNYRIPRLFIDVIDAFHTQNTDLMQECCKKYLDITRESKIKDSILKDLELNNKLKEKDDIIKSKDIELEDKNKIIISQQQEINKLKEELMKFKKSLSNLIGE
jgi:hypothetical protein